MTIIESRVIIDKPAEFIYAFLRDFNNHQQLMPENIYNWTSTHDEARFTIQNMAKLALKAGDCIENQEISIVPTEQLPFEMTLKWILNPSGTSTEVVHQISAELNMMMQMIAKGPLQKLADHETSRLKEVLI